MAEFDTGGSARAGHRGKVVIANPYDGSGVLVARITQWRLNRATSETAWGDSDSQGFTNRKAARRDATGSITFKYDETSGRKPHEYLDDGDRVKLVLWEDNIAEGGTNNDYYVFPSALIQNVEHTVNPDTKEVIEVAANFGSDGRYYKPGEAGAPSETLPSLP